MSSRTVRVAVVVLLLPLILLAVAFALFAEVRYPETIRALQAVYLDEARAQVRYAAFAEKAHEEGYPQIAYFFKALSVSEGIHARNAREVLDEIGSEAKKEQFEPEVSTTRENLKFATSFEINIIQHVFPGFLEKITPEHHVGAIKALTNELATESQHLDLLKKIQKGTGAFFGMLAKKFEGTPVEYFVCHVCGATTIELPERVCPICKSNVAEYKLVKRD